jgi:hypothetical protein
MNPGITRTPVWVRPTPRLCALGALSLCILTVGPAPAAPPATRPADTDDRIRRLEQRLLDLERSRQADQQEIARLRSQLDTRPAATAPAAPARDTVEKATEDALRRIEAARGAGEGPLSLGRPGGHFNPRVAVVIDTVGSFAPGSSRRNDAYNRFDIREVELDLRATIEPRVDGVLIFTLERDVENPPFPEAGGEAPSGPDTGVNLEEGYAFLHDFGVPDLTAKVGRFYVRFGRQNLLHPHDLLTVDSPLANQAFLAPEALGDAGISLAYRIPSRFVAGQHVEVIGELLSGEGAGSESPTLAGDLTVDSPAVNLHALWNLHVARDWNLELGGSFLSGHAGADNGRDVRLYGIDATLVRTGPAGRFNDTLLQAELFYGDVDQAGGSTEHAFGTYALVQQQLARQWAAGLRLDWTQDPNDDDRERWAINPFVTWSWSEFVRWRLQYQHRGGDGPSEDVLYLQATFTFGAHPAHDHPPHAH